MIVQELHAIQERHGYLPAGELHALSERLKVPLHRLHEVASFYPLYRLKPPPNADVKVCRDMACHLHGAPRLTRSLQAYAHELSDEATQVVVEGVSCLGQCDCPVAVSINDHIYRGQSETELRKLIDKAASREPLPPQQASRSPLGWKIDSYNGQPRYEAVKKFLGDRNADAILKALEVSN